MELAEKNIIILGSDGLFDNVFDHEIVSTVAQYSEVVEAGLFFLLGFTCIYNQCL